MRFIHHARKVEKMINDRFTQRDNKELPPFPYLPIFCVLLPPREGLGVVAIEYLSPNRYPLIP